MEDLAYVHRLTGTRHDVSVNMSIAGRPARAIAGVDLASTNFSSPRSCGTRVPVSVLDPEAVPFDAPERADDRRADLWQASAFGELRVDLLPATALVLGGRAGRIHNDIARPASGVAFEHTFTPRDGRVGIVVSSASTVGAYAQYATGSEPVEALLILGPAESGFTLARSSLWEGGVKATLWNGRADVTAAIYRLAKERLTTTDPEDSTRTIQVGEQSSKGVELSLVARPTARWLVKPTSQRSTRSTTSSSRALHRVPATCRPTCQRWY